LDLYCDGEGDEDLGILVVAVVVVLEKRENGKVKIIQKIIQY